MWLTSIVEWFTLTNIMGLATPPTTHRPVPRFHSNLEPINTSVCSINFSFSRHVPMHCQLSEEVELCFVSFLITVKNKNNLVIYILGPITYPNAIFYLTCISWFYFLCEPSCILNKYRSFLNTGCVCILPNNSVHFPISVTWKQKDINQMVLSCTIVKLRYSRCEMRSRDSIWFCRVGLTVREKADPHQYFSCSLQNLYSLKREKNWT